jgi:hypothetical protein
LKMSHISAVLTTQLYKIATGGTYQR